MYVSRSIIYCAILLLSLSISVTILIKFIYPLWKERNVPRVINIWFSKESVSEVYQALNQAGITLNDSQKSVFENVLVKKEKTLGFINNQ